MGLNKDTGVMLLVHDRPEHTRRVLDGLRENKLEKLHVFADGPGPEDDLDRIERTRELVKGVEWCDIELIEREENLGLAGSVVRSLETMFDLYEKVIRMEDDCVPSPGFLSFMTECLDRYENEDRVMNVHGYCPPIDIPDGYPYDMYFTYRPGSWGMGLWKDAFSHFKPDIEEYYRFKRNPRAWWSLRRTGYDNFPRFVSTVEGDNDSIDIWWMWALAKRKGLSVNPVQSRIKNIGFDGSGENCRETDKYEVEINSSEEVESDLAFPERIEVNHTLDRRFRHFYGGSLWKNIARQSLGKAGLWKYVRDQNLSSLTRSVR